ncbi:uncharacterized protein LOC129591416 [Paramacrobiotus metropolitanus]|uniref:uncharacterized protein LOC129591416 n=1 Tax=Paramacrobiotus metropolitanus TaxID=2943436 RepID=UPI002445D1C4|nr:uncharacterized protein LOC129591416 [Paramacrobiotus metropolitanus]
MVEKRSECVAEKLGSSCEYRYDNDDFIASGAFGMIYKGTVTFPGDFTGSGHVAVKVVHIAVDDAEKWNKFYQRLKTLVTVRHDNLISYHKVTIKSAETGAKVELVMDYCAGDLTSLFRMVRQHKCYLDYQQTMRYAIDIAQGLDHLHDMKMIHGDMKPGNILVKQMPDGPRRLLIGDMDDMVHMQKSVTVSADITHPRGTLRYMSPEMLKKFAEMVGAELPGRMTDVWSLGCIILELAQVYALCEEKLLQNKETFVSGGNDVAEQRFIQLIISGYTPFVNGSIPPHLGLCIQQCLNRNTDSRLSARKVLDKLHEAQDVLPARKIACWHKPHNRDSDSPLFELFDPSNNTIQSLQLPPGLLEQKGFDWKFEHRIVAFNEIEIALIFKTPDEYWRAIFWNVRKCSMRSFGFPTTISMVVEPVAVNGTIYFWDYQDGTMIFKATNIYEDTTVILESGNQWQNRHGSIVSSTKCGNKIVYIGTQEATGSMWVECFNTATGIWQTLPDVPDQRKHFAMVMINENIYLLGGITKSFIPEDRTSPWAATASCLHLNLQRPNWEEMHPFRQPRFGHSACAVKDQIYVHGGMAVERLVIPETEMLDIKCEAPWATVKMHGTSVQASGIFASCSSCAVPLLSWKEDPVPTPSSTRSSLPDVEIPRWKQLKEKGNAYFKDDRFTDAKVEYTKALESNPGEAVLYSNRALCELQLGNFGSARKDAEQAIALAEHNVKYYCILSKALLELDLLKEALSVCQRGLKIDANESTLLKRQRDLQSQIAQKFNTSHPRPDPKISLETGGKRWNDVTQPEDTDVRILDDAGFQEHQKQHTVVGMAHIALTGAMGQKRNLNRAFKLFKEAADLGSAEGQYNLAHMYGQGEATHVNHDLMLKYYRFASAQKPFIKYGGQISAVLGVSHAEHALGVCYRDGIGFDKNPRKSVQHFLKAAKWGHAEGQNNAGAALLNGEGVAQNLPEARYWFERAAKQGIAEAQLNYASMLEDGRGGPVDKHSAFEYYRKAAEQGSQHAIARLWRLSNSGDATAEQQEDLAVLLGELTTKENVHILHFLAGYYYHVQHFGIAVALWTRAAELGHADSQIALSQALLEDHRYTEAFPYCVQASERGDLTSQLSLARLLAQGSGCQRDVTAAREWFQRAINHSAEPEDQQTRAGFERLLQISEAVCEFERSQLSEPTGSKSMKWSHRVHRYFQWKGASAAEIDVARHFDTLSEHRNPVPRNSALHDQAHLVEPAAKGSITAKNVVKALAMVEEGYEAWQYGDITTAFHLIRESTKFYDVNDFYFSDMLAFIQENNLETADALFVKACHLGNDIAGNIAFMDRCIRLHPKEADFHHLLACYYGFGCMDKELLASVHRAYELEPRPNWLYTVATGLRKVFEGHLGSIYAKHANQEAMQKEINEVIAAYQRYFDGNPKDERKVPAAQFYVASLYAMGPQADVTKVLSYYKKACEADTNRIKFFDGIPDDFPPKLQAEMVLRIVFPAEVARVNFNINMPAHDHHAEGVCTECGKPHSPYTCVCLTAVYCGKECQKTNWKWHKAICAVKFAKMQKLHKRITM